MAEPASKEASKAVAKRPSRYLSKADELTTEDLVAQVMKIQEAMRAVMKEDVHYGIIPGTEKPTLLKPGAEKLCLLFRLAPTYEILKSTEDDSFLAYTVICTLTHIPTEQHIADGVGSCNSREAKYRYRTKKRMKKPGQDEADKLVAEGKGRWRKVRGAWAFFDQVENDNPWELQNTLLKMASKRALVAAVLNGTAASDIFAQDIEDMTEVLDLVDEDAVEVAMSETIEHLRLVASQAAAIREDLWAENVLIANAQRAFKRKISKLEDLTDAEATQIIDGAKHWMEENVAASELEPLPEEVTESE